MTTVLPPVNGVMTFKCQSGLHYRCRGAWVSLSRQSRVACGCECHSPVAPAGMLF